MKKKSKKKKAAELNRRIREEELFGDDLYTLAYAGCTINDLIKH